MPHPSKRKGNRFERELVDAFQAAGLRAERAFGSNGEALTTDAGARCTSDVDLLVEGRLKIQAKRRKAIARYLCPPDGAHVAIIREDRGDALVTLPLDLFTRLLTRAYRSAQGETAQPPPQGGIAPSAAHSEATEAQ